MSALQAIRNKGVLVAAAVGFALLAFILTDFLNSANSLFSENSNAVAVINGKEIDVMKYSYLEQQLINSYEMRSGQQINDRMRSVMKNQAWEQLMQEALFASEFEKLGLGKFYPEHNVYGITKYEFEDLLMGKNIDPDILNIPIFKDKETGQFKKELVQAYIDQLSTFPDNQKQAWLQFEKEKLSSKLRNRYISMIKNGIYTTKAEAEFVAEMKNKTIDFDYVGYKYDFISDSAVSVSNAEIEDYYNDNIENYKSAPSRELEYVRFEIKPSDDDYNSVREHVMNMKEELKNAENPEIFVNRNSDIPYSEKFFTYENIHAGLRGFLDNIQVGDVLGTYYEDFYYKAARFVEIAELPDSVTARHILLKGERADAVADSLIEVINAGGDFEALAKEYSEDPGSKDKGGLYEQFPIGQMVKPFNDTCFYGVPNKLYKVPTQFGTHIIEVLKQNPKKTHYKLAIIAKKVEPSNETHSKIFKNASKFAFENTDTAKFNSSASTNDEISLLKASVLKSDYELNGLPGTRELVQWAFTAEKGQVSNKVYKTEGAYIVAAVIDMNDEEYSPIAKVENQIKAQLIKDKKAEKIIAEMNASNIANLDELSKGVAKPLQTVEGAKFASYSQPRIGHEPAVMGALVNAEEGKVYGPIKGEAGVYCVKLKSVSKDSKFNAESEQESLSKVNQNLASNSSVSNALKNIAEIIDNRIKF